MGVCIGSFNLLLARSYSAREMSLSSETNGSSEPWPAVGTKEKSLKSLWSFESSGDNGAPAVCA